MALVQGSKEPRRVREHEREGRRDAGIGLKRVSSKALAVVRGLGMDLSKRGMRRTR